jgi:hypothetical protein
MKLYSADIEMLTFGWNTLYLPPKDFDCSSLMSNIEVFRIGSQPLRNKSVGLPGLQFHELLKDYVAAQFSASVYFIRFVCEYSTHVNVSAVHGFVSFRPVQWLSRGRRIHTGYQTDIGRFLLSSISTHLVESCDALLGSIRSKYPV